MRYNDHQGVQRVVHGHRGTKNRRDNNIVVVPRRRSSAIKSPRTETERETNEGKSSCGGGLIMPNKKLSWFPPKTRHAAVAVMVDTLTRTLIPKKKKKKEEEESHAHRRGGDESPDDDDDDDSSGSCSDEEEDGGDSSSFSSSSSSSSDSASSSSSEEATTMTQSNNGGETKKKDNKVPKKSSRDEHAINNNRRRRNNMDTKNGGVGALSSTPRSDYVMEVLSTTPIAKGEIPNNDNVDINNSGAGNDDDDGDGNYSDSSSENCGCGTYRGRGSLSSGSSRSFSDGSSHRSNGGGSIGSSRGSSNSRRDSSSTSSANEGGRSVSSSSSSSDSLSMKSSKTKDTISHAIVDDDDDENEELEDASTDDDDDDDDDDDNDTNHLDTVQLSQPTLSEWTEGVYFETSTSSLEELAKVQRQREEQIKKGEEDASIITTPTTTATTTTEMQWLKPKAIAIRAAVGMHGQPTRRASAADAAKTKSSNSSLKSLFHRSLRTGADSADAAATADHDSVSATTTTASTRWKNTQVAVAAAAATTKKAEIAATKAQSLSPSIYNDEQISMMMQRSNSFRGGKGRGGGMQRTGSSTRLIDGKGLPPRPSRAFTVDSNKEDDANANDEDEEEDEEDVDFTDLLQKVKIARTALDRWKGMVTENLFERSNDDEETIMDDNMMMTKKDTLVDEVQSNSPSLDIVYTKDDDEVTGKRLSSHVSSVMTELKKSSKHSNGDGVSACRMSEMMPSENYDAPIYASTIELAQLRLMKAMKRVDNVSECTPKQEIYTAKKELFDAKAHLETLRMMINNTLYCGTSTEGYITDVPSLPVETVKHKIDGHSIQTNFTNEFSDNDLIHDTSSTDDDYTDNDYYSTEEYRRLSVVEEISVESVDTPTDTYDDQSLCTRDDNELVVCATTECNAINNTNLASSTYEEDVSAQTVVKSEFLDKTEMSSHQQRSSISTCSETLSPSPELKHSISRYSTTADVLRIFDELCCISTTNSRMQESNDPHLLMPMGISTDLDSKWLVVTTSSSEIESRVLHTHSSKH